MVSPYVEPALYIVIGLAGFLIYLGARLGWYLFDEEHLGLPRQSLESQPSNLTIGFAFAVPIIGSIALLLLFFFLDKIALFLVIWISLVSVISIGFVTFPFFYWLEVRLKIEKEWDLKYITITPSGLASFFLGICGLVFWLTTRGSATGILSTDLIAVSLILTSIASLRIGAGDLILPGIFLSFLFRFDHNLKSTARRFTYFRVALIGYILGLFAAFIAVNATKMGQPALLYLVPATMVPIIALSYKRGELGLLWKGTPRPLRNHTQLDTQESNQIEMIEEEEQ